MNLKMRWTLDIFFGHSRKESGDTMCYFPHSSWIQASSSTLPYTKCRNKTCQILLQYSALSLIARWSTTHFIPHVWTLQENPEDTMMRAAIIYHLTSTIDWHRLSIDINCRHPWHSPVCVGRYQSRESPWPFRFRNRLLCAANVCSTWSRR